MKPKKLLKTSKMNITAFASTVCWIIDHAEIYLENLRRLPDY
jgi:hypothetical protein